MTSHMTTTRRFRARRHHAIASLIAITATLAGALSGTVTTPAAATGPVNLPDATQAIWTVNWSGTGDTAYVTNPQTNPYEATKLNYPRGVAVDSLGRIYTANLGAWWAAGTNSVTVHAATADGAAAPLARILPTFDTNGSTTNLGVARSVAIDPYDGLWVAYNTFVSQGIYTDCRVAHYAPLDATSPSDVRLPTQVFDAAPSLGDTCIGLAVDRNDHVYVDSGAAIAEFAGSAGGDPGDASTWAATPVRTITGSATNLGPAQGGSLAVDPAGNLLVVRAPYVLRFGPTQQGNVTPESILTVDSSVRSVTTTTDGTLIVGLKNDVQDLSVAQTPYSPADVIRIYNRSASGADAPRLAVATSGPTRTTVRGRNDTGWDRTPYATYGVTVRTSNGRTTLIATDGQTQVEANKVLVFDITNTLQSIGSSPTDTPLPLPLPTSASTSTGSSTSTTGGADSGPSADASAGPADVAATASTTPSDPAAATPSQQTPGTTTTPVPDERPTTAAAPHTATVAGGVLTTTGSDGSTCVGSLCLSGTRWSYRTCVPTGTKVRVLGNATTQVTTRKGCGRNGRLITVTGTRTAGVVRIATVRAHRTKVRLALKTVSTN